MTFPSPNNGEPFYCAVCGLGYGEYVACELPDCRLESRETAKARQQPVRLRLSRRKGFNLQAWSRRVNGLNALKVARPGRWSNPHKVAPEFKSEGIFLPAVTPAIAVRCYREHLERAVANWPSVTEALRDEVAGRNLACWCRLCPAHQRTGKPLGTVCADCAPCHADVLLELANPGNKSGQDARGPSELGPRASCPPLP